MAFPAPTGADGTLHTEGGKKFVAKSGKWRRRPGCRVFSTALSGAGQTVWIKTDSETNRLLIKAAFRTNGDGHLQVNFSAPNWLTPNSMDYRNVSGDLTNGPSGWRRGGDWKGINTPPASGFYLNWATDEWRSGNTQRGFAEMEVVQVDAGFSVFTWCLLAMKLNEHPMKTEGCCNLNAVPSKINGVAFNTSSGFSEGSLVVEAY